MNTQLVVVSAVMGLWVIMPSGPARAQDQNQEERQITLVGCVNDVTGYHIHARDGDIGHVDDFLVDPTV